MHSQDQIERALLEYDHRKSIAATIRYLDYPSRNTLYEWIKKDQKERREKMLILFPVHGTKDFMHKQYSDPSTAPFNRNKT